MAFYLAPRGYGRTSFRLGDKSWREKPSKPWSICNILAAHQRAPDHEMDCCVKKMETKEFRRSPYLIFFFLRFESVPIVRERSSKRLRPEQMSAHGVRHVSGVDSDELFPQLPAQFQPQPDNQKLKVWHCSVEDSIGSHSVCSTCKIPKFGYARPRSLVGNF
jgi:hypothetical protein